MTLPIHFVVAVAAWTELRQMRAPHDAEAFDASFAAAASVDKRASRILDDLLYLSNEYIGAPTDLLQHSVQTAEALYSAGEDEELVVAGLVHDIGELHVPVSHGEVAASYLRPHVRPRTAWILEHHEIYQFAHYAHAWGVANTTAPRDAFSDSAFHKDCIRFCEYDEAAFNASAAMSLRATRQLLKTRYEPMLRRVLMRPSFWWDRGLDASEHGAMVSGKARLLTAYPDVPSSEELNVMELAQGDREPTALPRASEPWTSSFVPKRFAVASLGEEGVLGALLEAVLTDGLCFVDGLPVPTSAPLPADEVWKMTKRIFAPRTVSHKAFWEEREVTADVHLNNFTNTAATDTLAGFHASYSLRFLPPHTDGTYLSTPPRVKILSTLAHEGELCANTFVDGHAAALFALERSERDTLALERITHVIKADPYSEPISFNRSILDHDGDGRVHIAWNAHEPRSSASSGARGARAKMATWINDPANAYSEVLSPGTVAIMDNWRVLHGREAVKGKWREMGGADVSDRTLRARWRALRAGSGS